MRKGIQRIYCIDTKTGIDYKWKTGYYWDIFFLSGFVDFSVVISPLALVSKPLAKIDIPKMSRSPMKYLKKSELLVISHNSLVIQLKSSEEVLLRRTIKKQRFEIRS